MTRKSLYALAWVLVAFSATHVFANDTSAELATGGLIFTKSDQVEMRSEDLFVSMNQIRVRYEFINHSDRDVVTQVAFPMPDIPYDADNFNFVIPSNDPGNILPFKTTAGGHPVAALVEKKAFLGRVDQTDLLRRLGVPIAPSLDQNVDYLSKQTWDELVSRGLIRDNGNDRHIEPRWTLKTTYYWQQAFPAHQTIIIDHHYQPSVGGVVPVPAPYLLNHPETLEIDRSTGLNRFCIDQTFLNAMVAPANITWEQHILEYILVTGANWSGPIATFRLVVDKGSLDNLVSVCGHGVRKISPTQFEMKASEFIPTSNLSILILVPSHPGTDEGPNTGESSNEQDFFRLSCSQLWYQRNSAFKAAGYCFHTQRATSIFGNAECRYDNEYDLPLSDRDREVVSAIKQVERMKRCSQ